MNTQESDKLKQKDYDDFKENVVNQYINKIIKPFLTKNEISTALGKGWSEYERKKIEDEQEASAKDWCNFQENLNKTTEPLFVKKEENQKDNHIKKLTNEDVNNWIKNGHSLGERTSLSMIRSILKREYKLEDAIKDCLAHKDNKHEV